jgi:hypothetical protein
MCTKVVPVTLKGEMQGRKCAKKLGQLLRKYVQANLLKYWGKGIKLKCVLLCNSVPYNEISYIGQKYCILDIKWSQCKCKSRHNASYYDCQLNKKLLMPT